MAKVPRVSRRPVPGCGDGGGGRAPALLGNRLGDLLQAVLPALETPQK